MNQRALASLLALVSLLSVATPAVARGRRRSRRDARIKMPPSAPPHSALGDFGELAKVSADSVRVIPCEHGPCAQAALRVQVERDGRLWGQTELLLIDRHVVTHVRREYGDQAQRVMQAVVEALLAARERAIDDSKRTLEDREVRALETLVESLDGAPRYIVREGVELAPDIELRVRDLARRFYRRFRQRLVITSGTRSPERQARAMYVKLLLGDNLRKLYAQRYPLEQVLRAYRSGFERKRIKGRLRKPRRFWRWSRRYRRRWLKRHRYRREQVESHAEIVRRMGDAIARQVKRGVFLSPHLRAGAVDIRSISMNRRERGAFIRLARRQLYVRWIKLERRPPHFHVDILRGESRPSWRWRWRYRAWRRRVRRRRAWRRWRAALRRRRARRRGRRRRRRY
ncbi:MAG: hypothetical protein KC503_29445 [Myxococcales bacterium]|nr:hypothetical protein [Myxococcales bacterium]